MNDNIDENFLIKIKIRPQHLEFDITHSTEEYFLKIDYEDKESIKNYLFLVLAIFGGYSLAFCENPIIKIEFKVYHGFPQNELTKINETIEGFGTKEDVLLKVQKLDKSFKYLVDIFENACCDKFRLLILGYIQSVFLSIDKTFEASKDEYDNAFLLTRSKYNNYFNKWHREKI